MERTHGSFQNPTNDPLMTPSSNIDGGVLPGACICATVNLILISRKQGALGEAFFFPFLVH